MRHHLSLLLLFLITVTGKTNAESWQGITPAVTTRAEVEKILGPPTKKVNEKEYGDCWTVYEAEAFRAEVFYLCFNSSKIIELETRKIPIDTVLRVIVTPKQQFDISSMGYDLTSFKRSEGHIPGDVSYSQQDLGLGIGTMNNIVRSLTYFSKELNDKVYAAK